MTSSGVCCMAANLLPTPIPSVHGWAGGADAGFPLLSPKEAVQRGNCRCLVRRHACRPVAAFADRRDGSRPRSCERNALASSLSDVLELDACARRLGCRLINVCRYLFALVDGLVVEAVKRSGEVT